MRLRERSPGLWKQSGYIGIGNRRGMGGMTFRERIAELMRNSDIYLPLTHTAVPTRGSITPTFTRATTETGQKYDEAGYLDFTALAGEAVFKGARRVRNLLTFTEDNTNLIWSQASVTSTTATTVTYGAAKPSQFYYNNTSGIGGANAAVGDVLVAQVLLSGTAGNKINLYIMNGAASRGTALQVTLSTTPTLYSITYTATVAEKLHLWLMPDDFLGLTVGTLSQTVTATKWQVENVTGQTTQTASEYVSVGVPTDWAGTEGVSNPGPDFTVSTGWSTGAGNTITVVDGDIKDYTTVADGPFCGIGFSVVNGTKYVVNTTVASDGTSVAARTHLGTSVGNADIYTHTAGYIFGQTTFEYTATSTGTIYVWFYGITRVTDKYILIDSLTIKPAAYHGSMVDGVKCYDTDRDGNPLPTSYTYDAVSLNGVAGTYVSTPDSVAASITGDIDIRARYSGDWSPSAVTVWGGKFLNPGQYSWRVYTDTSGTIWHFQYSLDGTNAPEVTVTATAPFADNTTGWWRVTRASATGYVNFYTSVDGVTWTPLGTQQTSTAGSLYNGTDPVQFGTSAFPLTGKIYAAQIYNGIDGTLAVDFDASRYAGGTTLTGSTGEIWTLQGNAVIHPTNYPLVGYVPWEARTNLCLQSNAFTTTWTNDGLVPVQDAVGPDGATSAWTLTDNAAGAVERILQGSITLTVATYTMSVFVKKTSTVPSANGYPLIFATQGANIALATIDPVNGTATVWTTYSGPATVTSSARCNSYNSNYWRVELVFLATAAAWTIAILPAAAAQGQSTGVEAAGGLGSQVFYGAQVELGSFATPYIPTTTVAVARNANLLTYTGADVANIKTLMIGVTPRVAGLSDAFTVASLSGAAANKQIYFDKQSAVANGTLYVRETTDQAFVNIGTYTAGVKTKVAGRFSTNNFAGCINGGTVGTDTSGTKPAVTQLNVGTDIAASVFINSPVGPLYGWTSRELSASELQAITA